MSVYTPLEFDEVAAFLARYDHLQLTQLQATTAGIENSNFFLDVLNKQLQARALVLTVFESVPEKDLPYFARLLEHLQNHGLPVPAPLHDNSGATLQHIRHKPCMLVPRLGGGHIHSPNLAQCAAIGSAMARIHVASNGFELRRQGNFDAGWREESFLRVGHLLSQNDAALMRQQLDRWQQHEQHGQPLPRGVTHGDLFHDNALFDGDRLTGIIDFYYACDDVFVYDLAILVNDWCNNEAGELDGQRYAAVLAGYQEVRTLTAEEIAALPEYLGFAALRFWLSRLVNARDPAKVGVAQKSPEVMKELMIRRMQERPGNHPPG